MKVYFNLLCGIFDFKFWNLFLMTSNENLACISFFGTKLEPFSVISFEFLCEFFDLVTKMRNFENFTF